MKTMTWGEIKKMMVEENVKDSDPVYIDVVEHEDEGGRDGMTYCVSGASFRCGGGLVELVAKNDLDHEDEENFL